MFVRLVQGILVTRWLISHLGESQYGLWVMLWSFFSYALLLDLGFGVAAQKVTATELYKKDIEKFDYRYKDADWKNSKDAIQRGMQKLKGGYPADGPYKPKL